MDEIKNCSRCHRPLADGEGKRCTICRDSDKKRDPKAGTKPCYDIAKARRNLAALKYGEEAVRAVIQRTNHAHDYMMEYELELLEGKAVRVKPSKPKEDPVFSLECRQLTLTQSGKRPKVQRVRRNVRRDPNKPKNDGTTLESLVLQRLTTKFPAPYVVEDHTGNEAEAIGCDFVVWLEGQKLGYHDSKGWRQFTANERALVAQAEVEGVPYWLHVLGGYVPVTTANLEERTFYVLRGGIKD